MLLCLNACNNKRRKQKGNLFKNWGLQKDTMNSQTLTTLPKKAVYKWGQTQNNKFKRIHNLKENCIESPAYSLIMERKGLESLLGKKRKCPKKKRNIEWEF